MLSGGGGGGGRFSLHTGGGGGSACTQGGWWVATAPNRATFEHAHLLLANDSSNSSDHTKDGITPYGSCRHATGPRGVCELAVIKTCIGGGGGEETVVKYSLLLVRRVALSDRYKQQFLCRNVSSGC